MGWSKNNERKILLRYLFSNLVKKLTGCKKLKALKKTA